MKGEKKERGAAAVEMAIVLPLLLILLLGIIEFGRIYNVQISLTQAAREGARYAAIHHSDPDFDEADVVTAALAGAPALSNLSVDIEDNASECAGGASVEVTADVTLASMSGLLDAPFFGLQAIFPLDLTGVGVMRCNG